MKSYKQKHIQKEDEILLRPMCDIKSRHWWTTKVKKLKQLLRLSISNSKNKKLIKSAKFTLLITSNKEIQYLNWKFRKKNKPTDVLSFSSTIKDHLGTGIEPQYIEKEINYVEELEADTFRMRKILKVSPQPTEDGIRKFLDYLKQDQLSNASL